MGFFKPRKKEVLDLTERYRKQQERLKNIQEDIKENSSSDVVDLSANSLTQDSESKTTDSGGGMFGFMSLANANSDSADSDSSAESSNSQGYINMNENQDKRKKLAKRLIQITDRLEDLSNQIYRLQQRMEVIERKIGVGNY